MSCSHCSYLSCLWLKAGNKAQGRTPLYSTLLFRSVTIDIDRSLLHRRPRRESIRKSFRGKRTSVFPWSFSVKSVPLLGEIHLKSGSGTLVVASFLQQTQKQVLEYRFCDHILKTKIVVGFALANR